MHNNTHNNCSQCNTKLTTLVRYCTQCGAKVDQPQGTTPRRAYNFTQFATVLFSDIVDSSSIISSLDPEHAIDVLKAFTDSSILVALKYKGTIHEVLGDGLVVTFSDDKFGAVAAAKAGLDMIKTIENMPPVNGQRINVRIGIATGDVLFLKSKLDATMPTHKALGKPTYLASMIQHYAKPNTLLVTGRTSVYLQEDFITEEVSVDRLINPEGIKPWRIVRTLSAPAPLNTAIKHCV